MASKNAVSTRAVSEDNDDLPESVTVTGVDSTDVDDIPDELNDEDEQSTPRSIPQTEGGATSGGMGLNKLKGLGFNNARDEQVRKMLNPPAGDWVKSERWKTQVVVYNGDCMPDDVDADGRTMLIFSGNLDSRTVDGIDYNIKGTIRISPDLRYKEDKPNEVDMAHKLFNRAKENLYLALHDERPTSFEQLIAMFEADRFVIRMMQGDNGHIAVDIKDPKATQWKRR